MADSINQLDDAEQHGFLDAKRVSKIKGNKWVLTTDSCFKAVAIQIAVIFVHICGILRTQLISLVEIAKCQSAIASKSPCLI